ncbi:MAG: thioesterase [Firmicutes bacterium HGW-Firmicutes-9]|jgi:predicted thioesterase|nr:MAG: thioesterase [Firmicutes bacterium HGW-Firmicutes-9]
MSELSHGVRGTQEELVTEKNIASALGSGGLAVYATPCMITLMEYCAMESVKPYLPEGSSTVGTLINVKHLAATPVGMRIRCETELIEVDRRRLVFLCRAYDEAGLIGEGTQERFIVDNAKFMEKTQAKRTK